MKKIISKLVRKLLPESFVFNFIYNKNKWGGAKGEFYSGHGSHNNAVSGYVDTLKEFIVAKDLHSIVEVGCGDFFVTNELLNHLKENKHLFTYLGYDVAIDLIKRNSVLFASDAIKFDCKSPSVRNIIPGDVLIIRQVLQHLSNRKIARLLATFSKFKYVIVTEQQLAFEGNVQVVPNLDQITGGGTRARILSGVYLDKEPFNCTLSGVLYSVQDDILGLKAFINTYLIANRH